MMNKSESCQGGIWWASRSSAHAAEPPLMLATSNKELTWADAGCPGITRAAHGATVTATAATFDVHEPHQAVSLCRHAPGVKTCQTERFLPRPPCRFSLQCRAHSKRRLAPLHHTVAGTRWGCTLGSDTYGFYPNRPEFLR